jgi:hypothetical protein
MVRIVPLLCHDGKTAIKQQKSPVLRTRSVGEWAQLLRDKTTFAGDF